MTSMAYQNALMNVRHVYRWDEPYKTAVYCSAYFLLLIVGHLGAGMVRTKPPLFPRGHFIVIPQC